MTDTLHIDGPEFGPPCRCVYPDKCFCEKETPEKDERPDERYHIYERGIGILPTEHVLVATAPNMEAVGTALGQLAEDRWEADVTRIPVMGVLDSERRRWVTGLWY